MHEYRCPTCEKPTNSGKRIDFWTGCMQRHGDPNENAYVILSERRSRDLFLLMHLSFRPDESTNSREPKRKYVTADIDLGPISNAQGEIRFCGFTCLRRWFRELIDRMEAESHLKPGETSQNYRHFRVPEPPPKTKRITTRRKKPTRLKKA